MLESLMNPHARELERVLGLIRKETLQEELLGEMLAHLFEKPGKLLRPWLCVVSARALPGTCTSLIPAAGALELLHTASLVHDDIMDQSQTRRGLEAIAVRYGPSEALLLGDWLLARSFEVLERVEQEQVRSRFARLARELCEGQMLELQSSREDEMSLSRYYRLIELKTASMFEASMGIGALCNLESTPAKVQTLSQAGLCFGVYFQIADDLLDLFSTSEKAGKDCGLDFNNAVRTLPVLKGLEDKETAKTIHKCLQNQSSTELQSTLRSALQQSGAIHETVREARRQLDSTMQQLQQIQNPELLETLTLLAKAVAQKTRCEELINAIS